MNSPYIGSRTTTFAKNVASTPSRSFDSRTPKSMYKSKGVTTNINFTESMTFNRDTFDSYIRSSLGKSLSDGDSLISLNYGDVHTMNIPTNGSITIDLNGTQSDPIRFLLNKGGTFNVVGNNSKLIIQNGFAPSTTSSFAPEIVKPDHSKKYWTNAGGIRQESGMIDIRGTEVSFENCQADGAGAIYILDGEVMISTGGIYMNNCLATQYAGGGLSMWTGVITLIDPDCYITAENCDAGSEGGGLINFGGTIQLNGDYSHLSTIRCRCGLFDKPYGFGGGISMGETLGGAGTPNLILGGYESYIQADSCQSSGSAAIMFYKTNISVYNSQNYIIAENNTTVLPGGLFQCDCAVYFFDSRLFSSDPIKIIASQNTCDDVKCDNATVETPSLVDYVMVN